ncbi:hypothetical protein OIV83_006132 [Microbotryomycetes sp. JL201]|nr:hypothetical protein OIV83_006132 [Microbotryomycetes sp. JL201]
MKSASAEDQLVAVAQEFLATIKDLTPGKQLELKLNKEHAPGTKYYDELARLSKIGLQEGWLANIEIDGPHYRRSRLRSPSEDLSWFSITAVYMDSKKPTLDPLHGQYHAHPYGEVNMVIPVSGEQPELEGLNGWRHSGWTCPGPGSHHFPAVRGGSLIALFFLPAGRISYNAKPDDPQPRDPGSSLGL